jgi:hypothetical protein
MFPISPQSMRSTACLASFACCFWRDEKLAGPRPEEGGEPTGTKQNQSRAKKKAEREAKH